LTATWTLRSVPIDPVHVAVAVKVHDPVNGYDYGLLGQMIHNPSEAV
jgi:hypothetical protein